MPTPSVTLSIIVVNWNTRDLLRDCLASVFSNLGGLVAEVIVVDNGSDDGSQALVGTDFPQVRLIKNTENRGFAAANNQGLEVASGKYVLLLNSDTIVLGNVLAGSVRYLDENTDVGAMGCRVLNTDGSMQPTCSRFPTLTNLTLLTTGLWKLPWPAFFDRYQMRRWPRKDERDVEVISGCYFLVRAGVIDEVGVLDEDFFFFGEETDWCRRIAGAGWKLRFAPVGEITHHGGGSVRKLNYKRDLMLSSATVKLHLKHNGKMSGRASWLIVVGFNLSRAVYWTLASGLLRTENTRRKRDHFVCLVRNFHRIWPGEGTYKL